MVIIIETINSLEANLCGIKYLSEVSASVVDFFWQISGVKANIFNSIIIHANIELVVISTKKVVATNSRMNAGVLVFIVSYQELALLA